MINKTNEKDIRGVIIIRPSIHPFVQYYYYSRKTSCRICWAAMMVVCVIHPPSSANAFFRLRGSTSAPLPFAARQTTISLSPPPFSTNSSFASPPPLISTSTSTSTSTGNSSSRSQHIPAAAASSEEMMAGEQETDVDGRQTNEEKKKKKKIFVAGSTGNTGRRIVHNLLSKGFLVRAGVLDIDRATGLLPSHPNLQIVKTDVTQGSDKLVEAYADSEAVICATGFRRSLDPFAPWKVDNLGTVNLVEACRVSGVKRFILISSILVNGAAMGQLLNPAYIILNLFGLTLIAKLQAERHIRKSGINYTIIRPGGLRNDPSSGNIIMEPEPHLSGYSL